MRRAVCPGSFDPVHLGHVDVVVRAATLFDEVVVAVGVNPGKSGRLFTSEERMAMLAESFEAYPNVRIAGFTGLIIDLCRDLDAHAIVKGLRGGADYEYELQMAQMNAHLSEVETVFLPTSPEYAFVCSSLVKEVSALGGNISALVPEHVAAALAERASRS